MTLKMESPGGWTPPGRKPAAHKSSACHFDSRPREAPASTQEPSGEADGLQRALVSRRLLVRFAVASGTREARGQSAKALLSLIAAGATGLSSDDAHAWACQLPSPIRDLRRVGVAIRTVRGDRRRDTLTRFVLECDPVIEAVNIGWRGGYA